MSHGVSKKASVSLIVRGRRTRSKCTKNPIVRAAEFIALSKTLILLGTAGRELR